jgi:folate-binding protein YgfZ
VQLELLEVDHSPFDRVIEVPDSPFLQGDVAEMRVAPLSPNAKDRVYFVFEEEWGIRVPKGVLGSRHEEWWIKKSKNFPGEDAGNVHWLTDDEWKTLRITNGAAEMGKDFAPDALPLEFPLLNAISFQKGCYIGQEVIARATYRGKMVRAWVRVEGDGNLEENALLYSELEPERAIGKLTSCHGHRGLGLVRFSVFDTPQKLFQKRADQSIVNITRIEDLSETAKES